MKTFNTNNLVPSFSKLICSLCLIGALMIFQSSPLNSQNQPSLSDLAFQYSDALSANDQESLAQLAKHPDFQAAVNEHEQYMESLSTFYQMSGQTLNKYEVGSSDFTPVANIGHNVFALAMNPMDHFLYGLIPRGTSGFQYDIIKIDANGTVVNLGVAPISAGTVYGGGFDSDGFFRVRFQSAGNQRLAKINLNNSPATGNSIKNPALGSLDDLSLNPIDGYLYGVKNGNLAQVDPVTADVIQTNIPGLGSDFDATWMTKDQQLYGQIANGHIYRIDGIATGGPYRSGFVGNYTQMNPLDGAGCPNAGTPFCDIEILIESQTNVECDGSSGGTFELKHYGGSSPYTYDWADLPGSSDPLNRSGLTNGEYTISITDANGCVKSATFSIFVEDNEAPTAVCQNASVEMTSSGTVAISASQINNGSFDNCGIAEMTVSPQNLDCSHIGSTVVTLTVEDVNGNPSTCSATVEVLDFISISGIEVVDESCEGHGDGEITITAESACANSSQIMYSVDGGATWQLTNHFEFLSPGNYDIVVRAQNGASYEANGAASVEAGPLATTWYMDLDDDGYPSSATQSACERPNENFKSATELLSLDLDCNDGDPAQFPGQNWYADLDGDGHGGGNWLEACLRPMGYFTQNELINVDGDCDDSDSAIHPDAAEICNGIDDDCDGEIDEGAAGGLTWTGDLNFANQAQVDDFSQCYSIIEGNLTIQNSNVVDLSNLVNLTEVTGYLYIKSTGLASLTGLDNLTTVGSYLRVMYNNSLTTLDGLGAVTSVGGQLRIYRNSDLTDCCAIHDLIANGGVGGSVSISRNDTGCDNVSEIETACAGGSNFIAPPGGGLDLSATAEMQHLDVFPNPTHGAFNLRFAKAIETGEMNIINWEGRVMKKVKLEAGSTGFGLDASDFATGVYLIHINLDGEYFSEKLIVR